MNSQFYDTIAEAYYKTNSSITKEFVVKPTLIKLIGDTNFKRILDLGCGSGYSTRIIREAGLNEIVGIDISSKQIAIARDIEQKNPKGISYYQGDVRDISSLQFKNFDVVTAIYLIHYASTKDELNVICKNISSLLKVGGKFVSINSNPDHPTTDNKKYGIIVNIDCPIFNGAKRRVTYLDGKEQLCSFETYFWRKDTYESALSAAGFKEIEWHRPIVSEEGISTFGKTFWNELIENPFICGSTCTKYL